MRFWSKAAEAPSMTLEGVLGPNDRLEQAAAIPVAAPDAVCVAPDGSLLISSGRDILRLGHWSGTPAPWARMPATITALAVSGAGLVAAGLAGGGLAVVAADGRPQSDWPLAAGVRSVADCLFLSEGELALVDHGYGPGEPVLALAPWDATARGQVVGLDRGGRSRVLAERLQCPMGLARLSDGTLAITEMERARVVSPDGRVLQAGFPGYLGRIRPLGRRYALACLSRRDPLIEFLKKEKDFVARMTATIDPRHWIAPRVTPEFAHDFPIELGATRLYGEIKPWAPSFSYGLMIELDDALMPTGSAQSRANGTRHAISDVASWHGETIVVSRASGELINLGRTGDAA